MPVDKYFSTVAGVPASGLCGVEETHVNMSLNSRHKQSSLTRIIDERRLSKEYGNVEPQTH